MADPTGASDEEIAQAGYPPRPAPDSSDFEAWLEAVSGPITVIPEHLVERPDLHFLNSTNWAGQMLTQVNVYYSKVTADFTVPTFHPVGATSDLALWPGLRGNGEIIQDGIYYQSTGNVGAYGAWHEFFPNAVIFNTSMVVQPGDEMNLQAWEGNSSCVFGFLNSGYGCFYYRNKTRNTTSGTKKIVDPGNFHGTNCVAMMESHGTASRFGVIVQQKFSCFDPLEVTHNIASDSDLTYNMVDQSSTHYLIMSGKTGVDVATYLWLAGN